MQQTLVQSVLTHGTAIPQKCAIGYKNTRLTYKELSRAVVRLAALLYHDQGIRAKDHVLISAVSKPEYIIVLLAVQYLGAVTIPVDKNTKEATLSERYDFVHAALFVTDIKISDAHLKTAPFGSLCAAALSDTPLTDTAPAYTAPNATAVIEMLFTTGTTAKPKCAMHTSESVGAIMHNTQCGAGMTEADVVLIPLPLNHSVGMRVLRTALYIGATVVIQNGFTFARNIEENIRAFSCTALVCVPASLELLEQQMQGKFADILGTLRYIEIGAGALSVKRRISLPQQLPAVRIINTWGSTETGGAIFWTSDDGAVPSALGKPVSGVSIKCVDSAGAEVAAHTAATAGRMALHGTMQMAGYYQNEEATKATLVDGWLYTNDLVYSDEHGYLYMLGRADDIINVGGEKVSPLEVENTALLSGQIRECACIGVADPAGIYGSVPVLYVVPESTTFDKKTLEQTLAQKLERYKLPHAYITIDSLPRNSMQKLDRNTLRAWWKENGTEKNTLSNAVISAIRTRRSIREFTERPIPRTTLEAIVTCGTYAPSGHNLQTWRFTVISDAKKIALLKELAERIAQEQKTGCYGFVNPAAVIIVSTDRRNDTGIQDASAATQNIMLAAHSLGLGSVWCNALCRICDTDAMRSCLTEWGIPQTHTVVATICMGYQKAPGKELARKQNVIRWV